MTISNSASAPALNRAGIALMKAGHKAEAKAKFQEVIVLEPTDEIAWLHLAALADSAAEAFTALNIVRKTNPTHPSITKIEAWIPQRWPDQVTQLNADDFEPEAQPQSQGKPLLGWAKRTFVEKSGWLTEWLPQGKTMATQNWGLFGALLIGLITVGITPLFEFNPQAAPLVPTPTNTVAQQLNRLDGLVTLSQNEGDQPAIIGYLEDMNRLAPDDKKIADALAESYYRQGISLRNAANFEAAQKAFNRALTIQETMDNALLEQHQLGLYLAGVDYYQDGQWPEAIEAFAEIYQQSPHYPSLAEMLYSAYFNQGVSLEANEDWEAAFNKFEQAQAVLPEMPEATQKMAQLSELMTPPELSATSADESFEVNDEKRVVVDISDQEAYTYQGDKLVHTFIVSTGEPGRDTAVGQFEILNKIPVAYASTWNLDMPFWLGIYWAGPLQNGFHALPTVRHTGQQLWDGYLGQRVSYGCIILGMEDAEILYEWVDIGTPVTVQW